ncbi:hypothetical protein JZX87_10145 [Agrobacterium sp. Ap1]|uniref:hypothetical protein n=1 Tax=Agrobacterium sp. Ap1 TaxID=2815337 RepID=UPI001A8F2BF2|nr:hypothetical protein [Agrobacterium sp. Ap1]MBO0141523.1 hypothetical protein [Agrobacterium sp. Ap1]
MVRKALMLLPLALLLMSNKGCQTIEGRSQAAAVVTGEAKASTPLPALDASCDAKTGRVIPKPDEPRVVTLKRWEVVADNRDRQSEDCSAWWADLSKRWGR